MLVLVALLFAVAPVRAGDALEAEHVRISSDIAQLAGRQIWPGVESKLAELAKLGVEPSYEDLLHGAYAARALGHTQNVYDRLKVAARIKGSREVVDWLFTIDSNYGLVELIATPPRGVTLEAAEVPFDPDQRVSYEAASERVRKSGGFAGLLPRGAYTYAGQSFTVQPGISVRIEVSPRLKRAEGEAVKMTVAPAEEADAATPPAEAP